MSCSSQLILGEKKAEPFYSFSSAHFISEVTGVQGWGALIMASTQMEQKQVEPLPFYYKETSVLNWALQKQLWFSFKPLLFEHIWAAMSVNKENSQLYVTYFIAFGLGAVPKSCFHTKSTIKPLKHLYNSNIL